MISSSSTMIPITIKTIRVTGTETEITIIKVSDDPSAGDKKGNI